MEQENFGLKLASLRGSKRMKQKELSAKSGIDQRTISRIENSKTRPSEDKVLQLLAALNVTMDEWDCYQPGNTPENNVREIIHNSLEEVVKAIVKSEHFKEGSEVRLEMIFKIATKNATN